MSLVCRIEHRTRALVFPVLTAAMWIRTMNHTVFAVDEACPALGERMI